MPLSPRRWRAGHLLAAWAAYWLALAAVVLWRPVTLARRLSELPKGRANGTGTFDDGVFEVRMNVDGATVWHGRATMTEMLLWVVGPPLVLWLLWLVTRPPRALGTPAAPAEASGAARRCRDMRPSGRARGRMSASERIVRRVRRPARTRPRRCGTRNAGGA